MEQVEPGCVEFLDLSGIEEQERNWILSSLHTWNPHIQLPWVEGENQQQGYEQPYISNVKQTKCYNVPPNLVVTANINLNENNQKPLYSQGYEVPQYVPQQPVNTSVCLGPVYTQQPNIPTVPPTLGYTQPEAAPNLHTTFVVNSNINYNIGNENSNAYINTKLEITQGFTNNPQQINGILNNGLPPETNPQYLINHVMPENSVVLANNVNVLPPPNNSNVPPGTVFQKQGEIAIQMEHNGDVAYPVGPQQNDFESLPPANVNVVTDVQESTPPPAKSWASLFNKSNIAEPVKKLNKQESTPNKPLALVPPFVSNSGEPKPAVANITVELKEPFKSNADDPNLHRMGEYLASHVIDSRIISLQPRGLINRSNYCYINSILQAVLACPPVYNLLCGLSENTSATTEKKKITPTIDSMTKFVKEFHHLPAGMRVGRRLDKNQKKDHSILINCDTPFEPFWIHKMLSGMRTDTFVVEGRQEDAEEFLGCLINGLNDEMLELMKLVGSQVCNESFQDQNSAQDEDKEWQVMGPKNKGSITRRTDFGHTPISDIFGGLLRSRLHRTGDQSTDNIQPFFTLQLNIEKTSSVREALEVLVCKNQLEGVTSSKTNEEVEAWQQVTLEELPVVLVLHLKCFDYKLDGCSKIIKALEFPIDLKIDAKMLSSKTNYTAKEKQYKLFAVVYHEGKEATKGHYITDAYHVGYASWLRYDDASVKAVPEEHVLKPHGTRVPYLLFYRRSDSLSKSK